MKTQNTKPKMDLMALPWALFSAQKEMNKQGSMVIQHVKETIMEVFEVMGFNAILAIE